MAAALQKGGLVYGADPQNAEEVLVDLPGGGHEQVFVDPEKGPWVFQSDGSASFLTLRPLAPGNVPYHMGAYPDTRNRYPGKRWTERTSTEREVLLQMAAKKNLKLRQWKGDDFVSPARFLPSSEELDPAKLEAQKQLEEQVRRQLSERCAMEMGRPPPVWLPITIDTVTANHARRAHGMIYGLEFPWSSQLLADLGPAWLTSAMQTAGTLPMDNKVVRIVLEEKLRVTTGNNGGKFLFDVEYFKPSPLLHEKLFAKVPFPLEGATKSDRLSSSVNKQPQELWELNTSRLLEASLPVKMPRFYFGDISNETSNWILITERVLFADHAGLSFKKPAAQRRKPLRPLQIEGPYDKCVDYNLRGDDREYYLLLVRTGARMAGMHKANSLGLNEALLMANFGRPMAPLDSPELWGANPNHATGQDPNILSKIVENALKFISTTGEMLFPPYVAEVATQDKITRTLMTLSAYSAEINYWKHANPDYTALAHTNLNVDNAYFWRDREGRLDCGVFDWGAMGAGCLGHKLWWWLYCSDHPSFRRNLPSYLEAFVESYEAAGGPKLDVATLETMVILTSMEQMLGLAAAVPQIMKMCPAKEWPTIQDRYDPRIAENVDGKSTLRLYLHVMNSIVRIIVEMKGDRVLSNWIQDTWMGQFGGKWKSESAIFGSI